jgi:hypothetical protein
MLGSSCGRGANTESFVMTSLKVGDLVELRAGTGTVGTVLDVVENRPRWILVDWHTPPDTCINPLLENEEFLTLAAGDGGDSQRRGRTASNDE